ncbi:MAG: hypothetical protein A3D31_11470 [Candidatus Fluviicola riflensis]|nr:MAG: hypothetical protein CHH17_15900 [Candidatus Fluviicola riflensis]OGS77609.1 MAG: hypothetical protein A3D31_11470 [Candidatus Fluviicola riflensis]OGS84192.1 MAG: hypothetical protein A3E30_12880 [Fluviicola sp. RIFCSPHIGHO2_12_FULL_43_24]OGS84675.1 MAG: hypothetical protein A2724_08405 [Fluviicola sp. RIFCSPHIGHO2_01_FULL_43_53]
METHFDLTDQAFIQQFEACALNPELFTHEAHLRLAWIHLNQYGEIVAIENVSKQLLNYVIFLGARDKYNQTLTTAAVKAVFHFINKSASDNFKDFIAEFPRLKFNFKELMEQHYTFDIFNSDEAKHVFLEPDLAFFD